MEATQKSRRKRKTQERTEITKDKLIKVALREFSERGFDAATVREIEVLAGVQRNLVSYHFGNKDDLWKAAATEVISKLEGFTSERAELIRDLPPRERIAYSVRSYVRFAAKHPELNRLMVHEGKQKTWRLEWITSEFLKPAMENFREFVKADLDLTDDEFVHWYYLFVSSGMVFTMEPEAEILFGVNVNSDEFTSRHADMMVEFLMSRLAK
ncbi:MAG: helix-turn-helix domain-containing protein [Pseudomonadota bacterium]